MVEHIVLFQAKPDASPESLEAMLDALRSLKDAVPGVVSLTCGANTSDRGGGFTHGLVVRFESQEALDNYLPHPAHRKVVEENVLPVCDEIVVCDYEI